MNSGDITLMAGIATLVVNVISAAIAVKDRKRKRRGRHRKR